MAFNLDDKIPGTDVTFLEALVGGIRGNYAYKQVTGDGYVAKALGIHTAQINKQGAALGAVAADVDNLPEAVRGILQDAAVTIDVSVNYPTTPPPA